MMVAFLLARLSCLKNWIIQARLLAEALRHQTISERLVIRKQLKTGEHLVFVMMLRAKRRGAKRSWGLAEGGGKQKGWESMLWYMHTFKS